MGNQFQSYCCCTVEKNILAHESENEYRSIPRMDSLHALSGWQIEDERRKHGDFGDQLNDRKFYS